MDIIMLSKAEEVSSKILLILDNLIVKNHWHNLNIYSNEATDLRELKRLSIRSGGYFVIVDIREEANWKTIFERVLEFLPQSIFSIIANEDYRAKEILNSIYLVLGYVNINRDPIDHSLERILIELHSHISRIGTGIFIHKNNELQVVPYEDILYVETIKMSHLCAIYTANSVVCLRADIRKLIKQMDCRFFVTRASTIANLSKVIKINTELQQIIFENSSCCTYAKKNLSLLRKRLKQGEFLDRISKK